MSLDARIETKARPMYGCHSDLDKYKEKAPLPCDFKPYIEERACEGCRRKKDSDE